MSGKKEYKLSKSSFIRGLQCEKSLYLDKNRPFLRGKIPELQKAKFKRGHEIGVLAQSLFPGGINVAPKAPTLYKKAFEETKKLIHEGQEVIYEAAFSHNGVNILLDILVKENNSRKAYEVKSSKKISETYLWDASIQYYVINKSGVELSDFFICHVNEDYILNGEVDILKLFNAISVFETVKKRSPEIENKIPHYYDVMKLNSSPDIKIGTQCNHPYPCDFIKHCWKNVPEISALNLFGINEEAKFELFHSGKSFKEILHNCPDLPKSTMAHIDSILNNRLVLKEGFEEFYKGLLKKEVLFYKSLFIEPALPYYQNTTPFAKTGIGFSVCKRGSDPFVFLSAPGDSPSSKYIKALFKIIDNNNTIIVYDKKTELEILQNHLKKTDLSFSIKEFESKLIDLKEFFNEGFLFWPEMTKHKNPANILKSFNHNTKHKSVFVCSELEAAQLYQLLLAECLNKVADSLTIKKLTDYLAAETYNISLLYDLFLKVYKNPDEI